LKQSPPWHGNTISAKLASAQTLALPLYPELSPAQQEIVLQAVTGGVQSGLLQVFQ